MRTKIGRAASIFALVAFLGVAAAPLARADSARLAPDRSGETTRREALLDIDEGLPLGGYFKLGRFAPVESAEPDDDWLERRSHWSRTHSRASIDRTFMAVEAGKDKAGVRGFVSAAGESQSGELEPRFTANAFRHWGSFGRLTSVFTTASVGTGSVGERRFYSYSGSSRFSIGRLTLVGYGALVSTEQARGVKRTWNARAEAGWRLARRLDTKWAYEWLDPNEKRRGDERTRFGVRLDPVFDGPVRGGVAYRKLRGPGHGSAASADELAIEIQVSF
jgi:hypothetical protein